MTLTALMWNCVLGGPSSSSFESRAVNVIRQIHQTITVPVEPIILKKHSLLFRIPRSFVLASGVTARWAPV